MNPKRIKQPYPVLTPAADKEMRDWASKSLQLFKDSKTEEALEAGRKALAFQPDRPELLTNVALLLNALHKFDEAETILYRSLSVQPGIGASYNLLGNNYKNRAMFGHAIAAYRMAVDCEPKNRDALVNMGKTYFEMQLFTHSVEAYERTLKLDPDYLEALSEATYLRDMLCRWDQKTDVRGRMLQVLESGEQSSEPFIGLVYAPKDLQLTNAMRWTTKLYSTHGQWQNTPLPAVKRDDGKLRIGYLSSDFHRHATLSLISEMFERHDRSRFELFAYSHGRDDGREERQRVKKSVDQFRDIFNVEDIHAVETMKKDGIDIIIDLKGYTQGHRLGLLARRPAPLQMHYLGYPGSTGAPFIDYFIADGVCAPEGMDRFFTESLIRLPHSYQINDRARPLPKDGPSRTDYGLPEEGFVFCGFNNPYKITPDIFSVWMRLLQQVEGSVLWLLETHSEVASNLKREAQARGVDPARIVTAPPVWLARPSRALCVLPTCSWTARPCAAIPLPAIRSGAAFLW